MTFSLLKYVTVTFLVFMSQASLYARELINYPCPIRHDNANSISMGIPPIQAGYANLDDVIDNVLPKIKDAAQQQKCKVHALTLRALFKNDGYSMLSGAEWKKEFLTLGKDCCGSSTK